MLNYFSAGRPIDTACDSPLRVMLRRSFPFLLDPQRVSRSSPPVQALPRTLISLFSLTANESLPSSSGRAFRADAHDRNEPVGLAERPCTGNEARDTDVLQSGE